MEQQYSVINWDDKDDIQKLLTVLEYDAASALNDALQFKYVLEIFDTNLDFINKAPCFWNGVITSLRYSMLMQAARLFDESRDAIGIKKILNIVEQSKYRDVAKEVLCKFRNEYNGYQNLLKMLGICGIKYMHIMTKHCIETGILIKSPYLMILYGRK
ncbi:MAG: hypothetical protein NC412_05920 [Roseburia sp.]|nr:hypothetical protein [Roseburia sp.]